MGKGIPKINANKKKVGVVIVTSNKSEFNTWSIKEGNKWHDIMQKTMNHNGNKIMLNMYAPNFITITL